MYAFRGFKRFKDSKSVAWERVTMALTRSAAVEAYGSCDWSGLKGKPIKLELLFCRPTWKTKSGANKGKYSRPDCSNYIKSVEDAVFKALGLDDGAVIDLTASKVEREGEARTIVKLSFIDEINN